MNLNKKNVKEMMKIILFAGIVLWSVLNYKVFFDLVEFALKLLMPLIAGIVIAFIINVPMRQIESKIFKIEKRKHKKVIRALSLVLSILLITGFFGLLLFLVIPEFVGAINTILASIPKDMTWLNDLVDKLSKLYPSIEAYLGNVDLNKLINTSFNQAGTIVTNIVGFLSKVISRVVMFVIGFVLSLYMLMDKEKFSNQLKKLVRAFCPDDVSNNIFNVLRLTNTTFTNFITGQFTDACIIGFLFFVILAIIRIPYALILGVMFTITALIPYIGAFITLVIGSILVGVINPINILWYVIVFFVVQQFDDNITAPRIVGGSVGLPPLWSLLAVLIGGSLFGFMGIFISIPLASITYAILREYVNKKLEKKSE